MKLTLKEYLAEASAEQKEVAKKSAALAQAVWAERNTEKKYELATNFINKMKFKKNISANLQKLETMKSDANKIDKFITDIQLKGEGQGVV